MFDQKVYVTDSPAGNEKQIASAITRSYLQFLAGISRCFKHVYLHAWPTNQRRSRTSDATPSFP